MKVEYHDVSGHKRYLEIEYEYAVTEAEMYTELWARRIEKIVLFVNQAGLLSKLRFRRKRSLTD